MYIFLQRKIMIRFMATPLFTYSISYYFLSFVCFFPKVYLSLRIDYTKDSMYLHIGGFQKALNL